MGRRDWPGGLRIGPDGVTLLIPDTFITLTVYEEPVFYTLYRDTLLPCAVSDLSFRKTVTGFHALENSIHRVGHMLLLALWGVESFGVGRD